MNAERESPELHRLDPTGRFSDRAEDYRRFRPGYPAAAIDALLEELGDPGRLIAADVGAGTGISAHALAERGVRVIAIEPNAEMREAARPHERIEWRDATAETTGLGPASVNLVLSAQAYHWFRVPESLAEFHRVLRPGGRLALMWNNRDRRDAFTRGYIEAIRAVNGEHPVERRSFDPARVPDSGRFTSARLVSFEHGQALDLAGLIGRASSASYVPKSGPAFERLRELLAALFEQYRDAHGRVTLRYETNVHLAQRLGRETSSAF